ncbi:MAG: hypothetical protein H6711_31580 [Myxococcales bacterium]|nr:hypothetical protein [Myxococcales bacterium]
MSLIPQPVGMAAFLAAIVVSRIVQERALRTLTTEEKGRLVEAFAGLRLFALVPVAAIAALYFVMLSVDALTTRTLLAIYLPAALIFALAMQVMIHRRLRRLELHPAYLRAYAIGRATVIGGLVVFMLSLGGG